MLSFEARWGARSLALALFLPAIAITASCTASPMGDIARDASAESGNGDGSSEPRGAEPEPGRWPVAVSGPATWVSPNGSDSPPSGDGSEAKPWRTIARAVASALETPHRRVRLAPGVYDDPELVLAGPRFDGLVIEGAGTGIATWTRGTRIAPGAWTPGPNGSYEAEAPPGIAPTIEMTIRWPGMKLETDDPRLHAAPKWAGIVDGAAATAYARHMGWRTWNETVPDGSTTSIRYQGSDLSAADATPEVFLHVAERTRQFDDWRRPIAIDPNTRTVSWDDDASYPLARYGSYALVGRADWVAAPGQFGFDPKTSRFRVLPPRGVNPASEDVSIRVPGAGRVLTIDGAKNVIVRNFEIADVERASVAILVKGGASNTVIELCQFVAAGGVSVQLSRAGGGNVLRQDKFLYGAGGAVDSSLTDGTTMHESLVFRSGDLGWFATGGFAGSGSSDVLVEDNDFVELAGYGTTFKTWNDETSFSNVTIRRNYFKDVMHSRGDGGASEFLGRRAFHDDACRVKPAATRMSSLLESNWYEGEGGLWTSWNVDPPALRFGQNGYHVYLDDLTSGVTVRGNVFVDPPGGFDSGDPGSAIFIHGGDENVIEDSLFVLGGIAPERANAVQKLPQVHCGVTWYASGSFFHNVVVGTDGRPASQPYTAVLGGPETIDENTLIGVPRASAADLGKDAQSRVEDTVGNTFLSTQGPDRWRVRLDAPAVMAGLFDPSLVDAAPRAPRFGRTWGW